MGQKGGEKESLVPSRLIPVPGLDRVEEKHTLDVRDAYRNENGEELIIYFVFSPSL